MMIERCSPSRFAQRCFERERGLSKIQKKKNRWKMENMENNSVLVSNRNDWSQLMIASSQGNVDEVKRLLCSGGDDVNAASASGDTSLNRAAKQGHSAVVEALLAVKTLDCDYRKPYGATAAMIAARERHTSVLKLMLDSDRVDVNAQSNDGWTMLIRASKYGYAEVIDVLLSCCGASIDLNLKTRKGNSALILAATNDRVAVARRLLAAAWRERIDVDAQNNFGQSALTSAARSGSLGVAQLLIDAGANTELRDAKGRTALQCAQSKSNSALVELLSPSSHIGEQDDDDDDDDDDEEHENEQEDGNDDVSMAMHALEEEASVALDELDRCDSDALECRHLLSEWSACVQAASAASSSRSDCNESAASALEHRIGAMRGVARRTSAARASIDAIGERACHALLCVDERALAAQRIVEARQRDVEAETCCGREQRERVQRVDADSGEWREQLAGVVAAESQTTLSNALATLGALLGARRKAIDSQLSTLAARAESLACAARLAANARQQVSERVAANAALTDALAGRCTSLAERTRDELAQSARALAPIYRLRLGAEYHARAAKLQAIEAFDSAGLAVETSREREAIALLDACIAQHRANIDAMHRIMSAKTSGSNLRAQSNASQSSPTLVPPFVRIAASLLLSELAFRLISLIQL
jgi:ankyrin repeat protein